MPADGTQNRDTGKLYVFAGGTAIVLAALLLAWTAGSPPSLDLARSAPSAAPPEILVTQEQLAVQAEPANAEMVEDETARTDEAPADNKPAGEGVVEGPLDDTVSIPLPAGNTESGLIGRVMSHFVASEKTTGIDNDRCMQIRRVAEASCDQQLFANQSGSPEECIARELRYTLWSTYGCQ